MATKARLKVVHEDDSYELRGDDGTMYTTPHVAIEVEWDHGHGQQAYEMLQAAFMKVHLRIEETRK